MGPKRRDFAAISGNDRQRPISPLPLAEQEDGGLPLIAAWVGYESGGRAFESLRVRHPFPNFSKFDHHSAAAASLCGSRNRKPAPAKARVEEARRQA